MRAEIIALGDELTSGQRLDTNSQWLSQQLGDLGLKTLFHTTAGDDLEAGTEVFRQAIQRADVILSTGGLGPTADDLTRECLARTCGVELVCNEAVLEHIRALFARRGRPMPERNVVQAMLPRGARAIANPHGTAPGIDIEVLRAGRTPARIFALPGVPAEMREMWAASVQPALAALAGADRRVIRHRSIHCFGAGESAIEAMLPDLIRRGRVPAVGITASQATITLRISAEGPSPEACQAAMRPTADTIYQCLGNLIFGEDGETLQDAVIRILVQRHKTLATVECGSGGTLAAWLSAADPERLAYRGGVVLRDPASPAGVLGGAGDFPPRRSASDGKRSAGFSRPLPNHLPNRLRPRPGTFPDLRALVTRPPLGRLGSRRLRYRAWPRDGLRRPPGHPASANRQGNAQLPAADPAGSSRRLTLPVLNGLEQADLFDGRHGPQRILLGQQEIAEQWYVRSGSF